ncbi:RimJ/RimL family protein N-acetyltransferase [Pseudoclavibacter sp. JAI123]|nr:RimJ/RimL family protein N-acetyltransferase [Pseudoclavibacter sp. JAI123]
MREFLAWPDRNRQQARAHLRVRMRSKILHRADDFMALALELDGRVIGDISLHLRAVASEVRGVEVGWVLHPDFQGKGYATEAAAAVARFAFEAVRARMVFAVVDPRNRESFRLARRLGFVEMSRRGRGGLLLLTEDALVLAPGRAHAEPQPISTCDLSKAT